MPACKKIDYKKLRYGTINVEPLSHKTFLYAYHILETLYGGEEQNMHEITISDVGVLVFDGAEPVGVCMINFHPINLKHPFVMNCCVLEKYKGSKWALRLLREMKKLLNGEDYYIVYAGEASSYKGRFDSVEAIVKSKAIATHGNYTLIRNG
jgi:hypothetical protein